ncbi:hypothetical protein RQ734_16650 [Roseomonas mucosa]|uniref:hypothetical protein n=1 Tax=Roseomonas mucosa TaxID=207340 RepID=UPI0028CC2D8F|nr:hypothetical protein [Roseomonas mucosa]MDT8277702.1 hypothetical protein [Roseomonas mucosa]
MADGGYTIEEGKPRLRIERHDPDRTVSSLRDVLATTGRIFDRGVPVRLAYDQMQGGMVAQPLTPDAVVLEAHRSSRPYTLREKNGEVTEVNACLPRTAAVMWLDWKGQWNLPPLNGIASAPLLHEDGSIHAVDGYDPATGLWCENVPDLAGRVPVKPTRQQAEAALLRLRTMFRTFPFADADLVPTEGSPVQVLDLSKGPSKDESSFLVALLTAACRPSLHLAPGMLITAAQMSGAGAGKGLLARCICAVAFGRPPHAVTGGASQEEMEKRIAAELMEGAPVLFLDNLNGQAFRSDLLASAITERPARVRLLGKSQMLPLNATAFIVLTGNGLTVSEDLARRFLTVELDPRTEDPETRTFTGDLLAEITKRRAELLGDLLTIWRWGRQAGSGINPGKALGSFGQWARWVRDPLLALGCKDPADRISEAKTRDQRRLQIAELFAVWWRHHDNLPVQRRNLHEAVQAILDPQNRGRNWQTAELERLAGTRLAGMILTRSKSDTKWSVATYALKRTEPPKAPESGTPLCSDDAPLCHPLCSAGGGVEGSEQDTETEEFSGGHPPMTPMTPMVSSAASQNAAESREPPDHDAAEAEAMAAFYAEAAPTEFSEDR